MHKIPPVNAIRAFEAVARHMQFQSAAEELGVTPSALSYQIKQLEAYLGLLLFKRMNRAIELTSAGELLTGRVSDAFLKLEEAFALLKPEDDDNTLVISSSLGFSAKWIAPRLHGYLELYPDIDFRLSASMKLVDFISDGVDAAIRFGQGGYDGLYCELLFDEVVLPLIAPSLFDQIEGQANEQTLQKMNLLHDDSLKTLLGLDLWSEWVNAVGYNDLDISKGARFSNADHAIETAIDGAGVIMGRLGFSSRDIDAGRLIAPFKQVIPANRGFYFVCPPSAMEKPKVLNFLGWLRDEVAEQERIIEKVMATKEFVL